MLDLHAAVMVLLPDISYGPPMPGVASEPGVAPKQASKTRIIYLKRKNTSVIIVTLSIITKT